MLSNKKKEEKQKEQDMSSERPGTGAKIIQPAKREEERSLGALSQKAHSGTDKWAVAIDFVEILTKRPLEKKIKIIKNRYKENSKWKKGFNFIKNMEKERKNYHIMQRCSVLKNIRIMVILI